MLDKDTREVNILISAILKTGEIEIFRTWKYSFIFLPKLFSYDTSYDQFSIVLVLADLQTCCNLKLNNSIILEG